MRMGLTLDHRYSRHMALRSTVLAAFAVLAALAPSASADTESATAGPVSATLSYDHTGDAPEWQNLQLTIARDGTQVFAADPSFGDCTSPYCSPAGNGESPSLQATDLDGDGEPEIVLDLYSGGAHCCLLSSFYRWDGAAYVPANRNWGDPGYRIADLDGDGVKELITGDDRFAYSFTAFAFSLLPVRIYDLRAGAWQLVTKRFPERIRSDARSNWRAFKNAGRQNEPRGAIAAWAADQYLLGRRAQARRTLDRLARAGRLPGLFPPKSQRAFVRDLVAFLGRHGY
jgi:hypothetical protein